jgi:hypothetical protein
MPKNKPTTDNEVINAKSIFRRLIPSYRWERPRTNSQHSSMAASDFSASCSATARSYSPLFLLSPQPGAQNITFSSINFPLIITKFQAENPRQRGIEAVTSRRLVSMASEK